MADGLLNYFRVTYMENIQEFRELLNNSKAELERRLSAIERDVRNETNPVSSDSQERSLERENDQVIDALGNSARVELASINRALSRIEAGEYFECEECGGPISEGRLRSVPYTSLCVECAEKQEKSNRENNSHAA